MSFTSIGFAICFPILLVIYYAIPEKIKKYYLILCSGIFYVLFDYRYIVILLFVTIVSYAFGVRLKHSKSKLLLATGIILSLLPLALLKYIEIYENLAAVTGISFYTIQAVGFMCDCFKGEAVAIKSQKHVGKDFLNYVLYMSFFPTIVSGPIKKYSSFVSQIDEPKIFDYFKVRRGMYMMAIGYVEKLFLANCSAKLVATVFDTTDVCSGAAILVATVTFGLQLYFDFAGYSYIAIGASTILGYSISDNFKQPYFSSSVKEFWRRWHISFSSFLKDYVYIPLGGNRKGIARKYINLMITFVVSGIWHGVGMNFVFWGALHGIYQVVGDIKNRNKHGVTKNVILRVLKSISVFALVDYAWLFFRVNSLAQGFGFTKAIIFNFDVDFIRSRWIFDAGMNKIQLLMWIVVAVIIFVFDIFMYRDVDVFEYLGNQKVYIRYPVYFAILGVIIVGALSGLGSDSGAFIYGGF